MTAAQREGGRYALKERIATGGMGEVWRAEDTVLGRPVAVKLLKREYADDPRFRERFESEARHAASLHHANIATVFDFGDETGEDGRPFLVMELVDGRPLSDLLRPGQPMDPDRVRDLVRQAAEALAQAHAAGIVHRDVKPANLLVTPAGTVKVTDFGIARAADSGALTGTGEVLGTPHYLAPEQAEGKVATPASDVYALGVVLFECLTGHRPFVADTPVATALAHVRTPVPDLPAHVPDDLAAVTRRALSKDPDERYLDAAALAAALGAPADVFVEPTAALATTPAPATAPATAVLTEATAAPAAPAAAAPRQGRRRLPAWWPLAALAVLGVILLVTAVLAGGGNGDTQSPAAGASDSPSSRVSGSADVHTLNAADYEGLDADEATSKLHALGYDDVRRTTRQGSAAGGANGETGTVASLAPTGRVSVDEPITLVVWGVPEKSAPTNDDGDKGPQGGDKHGDKHGDKGGGKGGDKGGDKGGGKGKNQ